MSKLRSPTQKRSVQVLQLNLSKFYSAKQFPVRVLGWKQFQATNSRVLMVTNILKSFSIELHQNPFSSFWNLYWNCCWKIPNPYFLGDSLKSYELAVNKVSKIWKVENKKRFYCGDHHLNLYDKGRLSFNKSSIEWYYRQNSVISFISGSDSASNNS